MVHKRTDAAKLREAKFFIHNNAFCNPQQLLLQSLRRQLPQEGAFLRASLLREGPTKEAEGVKETSVAL